VERARSGGTHRDGGSDDERLEHGGRWLAAYVGAQKLRHDSKMGGDKKYLEREDDAKEQRRNHNSLEHSAGLWTTHI